MSPVESLNLDNMARIVAIISDTHIGSPYGPWPDEPIWSSEGGNVTAKRNPGQLELLRSWKLWLDVCNEFRVDTIIHLGDALQGCNPKEGGRATMDPDMEVQKEAAEIMLRPLVKDRIYHQMAGTTYHESLDMKLHKHLVKELRHDAKQSHYHGPVANLKLRGTDKVINIAHAATNALIYPSTMLDREHIFLKWAEAKGKLPRIDIMVRGHLHFYFHLDYSDMHILQCPGWMAWFPYRDKVRLYGKMQPDIGGLIILIDKQNRMIPLHFLYPCPHIIDAVKDG